MNEIIFIVIGAAIGFIVTYLLKKASNKKLLSESQTQAQKIISNAKNEADKAKVSLILNEVFPEEDLDVPDPYHGGDFGFRNAYKMLDEACELIAKKIN